MKPFARACNGPKSSEPSTSTTNSFLSTVMNKEASILAAPANVSEPLPVNAKYGLGSANVPPRRGAPAGTMTEVVPGCVPGCTPTKRLSTFLASHVTSRAGNTYSCCSSVVLINNSNAISVLKSSKLATSTRLSSFAPSLAAKPSFEMNRAP